MCYPCTHCNKCGRNVEPGTCPSCGHVNALVVARCEQCGAAFPAPPGVSQQDARAKETRTS